MKKVFTLAALAVLLLGVFAPVFAQESSTMQEEVLEKEENMMEEDQMNENQEVNSFELFWPVVAGRTMGSPIYTIKLVKEKVRGALIFGKAQKAEYFVFLATKRVVEAEQLLGEGKSDLAAKTLGNATVLLDKSEASVSQAGESISTVVDEMNKKLDNLETFLPSLASKNDGSKDSINGVLDKVRELHQKI